ncbi:PREDICTED: RNA-binding protein squid-like isoform X2 [Priapulus caudatus]|uniref:RNA-binding protein squid-like isoform X2 n=1 Tax=Priapulus caudatus TaxID=37621 RepID=A0ABM1EZ55_PRICU|nr:PREDICTED: RNA-binding protein squid-like isoform X2 [Priapulus caudatus]
MSDSEVQESGPGNEVFHADDENAGAFEVPATEVADESKKEPEEQVALVDTEKQEDGGHEKAENKEKSADPDDKTDEDERKLFVGGLSWESTQKDVRDYFSKFGEVVQCIVKTDPNTGRSRGFGFIVFASKDSIEKVMATTHTLKGKQIDPKVANKRPKPEPIKKVFVGGVPADLEEAEIRKHFEKFGKISELALPFDKVKSARRNFCFVLFETGEGAQEAVKSLKQTIGGHEVDVKLATPKDQQGGWGGGWVERGRGGRGGRGTFQRGRGGRGGGWNQGGGWGGGYDQGYGGGYGGYGNYDYGSGGYGSGGYGSYGGYGSGYAPGGQNYDYSSWGYDGQGYGGYGGYGNGGAYDYSGWGYGDQSGGDYGKQKGGGRSSGYHPYQRQ